MTISRQNIFHWSNFILLSILIVIALIRLRLLDFPLERDEGEYAYIGQLILQGIPPYEMAYNMKLPGVYYSYALIMTVFGQTLQAIHLGFMLINLFSIFIIFKVANRFFTQVSSLLSALVYGLLSTSYTVLGFAAHATHFVILMSLLGTWFLLVASERKSYFWYGLSGVFYGLSFLMKQHALFFILFGIIFTFFQNHSLHERLKKILCLGSGFTSPICVLFFAMYISGVFEKFWFWTATYAWSYENQISIKNAANSLMYGLWYVTRTFFGTWLIALVGFIQLTFKPKMSTKKLFIILFTFFSLLTVFPGFYFRPHYFITLLPAIAILFASAFQELYKLNLNAKIFAFTATVMSLLIGIFLERDYLIFKDTTTLSYHIYGKENSFPQCLNIGKEIQSLTQPFGSVFVFGSEPQVYFYSKRKSATGYLYMYPLKEKHPNNLRMQQEMIREVEAASPELIVHFNTYGSWGTPSKTLNPVFEWFDEFSKRNYKPVSMLKIVTNDPSVDVWGKSHLDGQIFSGPFIQIFIRN